MLSIELGSGLVAIVVAYVVGFHLYGLAELTLLSKMKIGREWQHYSAFLLYDHDPTKTFDSTMRERIRDYIRGYFDNTPEGQEHARFLPARTALLHHKLATYVEQAQGMYVMARGISLACGLGTLYLFGWLASGLPDSRRPRIIAGLVAAASVVAAAFGAAMLAWVKRGDGAAPRFAARVFRVSDPKDRVTFERRGAWFIVGALGAFLMAVASWRARTVTVTDYTVPYLTVAMFGCVLASLRSYAAFRYFALVFARTVYEHFYVMRREAILHPGGAGQADG